MPFTFTHPIAVLPFRRLCPARLNFAALVIGSMSPDFGYFARQFPAARYTHTIAGTFAVCLPAGLLALVIFHLLRRPLCFVLPQPHRAVLMPLASVRPRVGWRSLLSAAVSVLLGAWTHTIWDSFTHVGGWSALRIPMLRAPLLHAGGTDFPISYVLQLLSSLVGGVALAIAYFTWLRRQQAATPPAEGSLPDRWRYLLLGALALVALALALPGALRTASFFEGYYAVRVFVVRTGIHGAAIFAPLLAISSTVLYAVHGRSAEPA